MAFHADPTSSFLEIGQSCSYMAATGTAIPVAGFRQHRRAIASFGWRSLRGTWREIAEISRTWLKWDGPALSPGNASYARGERIASPQKSRSGFRPVSHELAVEARSGKASVTRISRCIQTYWMSPNRLHTNLPHKPAPHRASLIR